MTKNKNLGTAGLIPQESIESKIFLFRGKKVMFDRDLAKLYSVKTSQLTRQVRRNTDRFPNDFMFQLTREEFTNLKCQFGISNWACERDKKQIKSIIPSSCHLLNS